jgi:hypothetical protein
MVLGAYLCLGFYIFLSLYFKTIKMNNFFERLLNVDPVRIATKYNVIVHLDVEKTSENEYSVDGLYISTQNFDLPKVLFQISSNDQEEKMNPTELKDKLYEELDRIRRCGRCSTVYIDKENVNSEISDCATCELELDYIKSRAESFSFRCGLCDQIHWRYYGKKSQCCKSPRLCVGCCGKICEMGFCSYCKAPIDATDFI